MAKPTKRPELKTAVLVVHGMGSQRPLDTARGIVAALRPHTEEAAKQFKVWTQPHRSGADIDLSVITISPEGDRGPRFDFHEVYWAHLMSETRTFAVLLWMFELVRKGPRLKPGMRPLWYGGAIFLCLLILAVAFLAIQGIVAASGASEHVRLMLTVPLVIVFAAALASLLCSICLRAFTLARWCSYGVMVSAILLAIVILSIEAYKLEPFVAQALPILIAATAVWFLMGKWGLWALVLASALSFFYSLILPFLSNCLENILKDRTSDVCTWNWSLEPHFTAVGSWVIIATYLALNAFFLRPFIGDAARYFRNSPANVAVRREIRHLAVDALQGLHSSGRYERIIVVAHSLGSVIAYDMLRTYFARICDGLPADARTLGPAFKLVDSGETTDRDTLRRNARELVHRMAAYAARTKIAKRAGSATPAGTDERKAWLVTDFITMGSPLRHAEYLLCNGKTADELERDFKRRIAERDLPTCPPQARDGTGRLAFKNPRKGATQFHHGAQFGLTRWTNIYFPRYNLFWGDAVGGPLGEVFGDAILDVEVYTRVDKNDFFSHTKYWDVATCEGRIAPHIAALINALDFEDRDRPVT